MTSIEWTHAPGYKGETWNPVVGCSVVSPGCANCYAMRFAGTRLKDLKAAPHYRGLTEPSKAGPVWTGKIAKAGDRIFLAPLSWKKPRCVFVNSMGDLFHSKVPDVLIDQVFAIMALAPRHLFLVLTKRPERMCSYLTAISVGALEGAPPDMDDRKEAVCSAALSLRDALSEGRPMLSHSDAECLLNDRWPLPNVWLGVSAEDQTRAEERVPILLETPAVKRFVSAEPLLGPIDFSQWIGLECRHDEASVEPDTGAVLCQKCDEDAFLDWIIVGGERGPRPMRPEWARRIRDDCAAASVPFFFKQWGDWLPDEPTQKFRRIGRDKAGRNLDGREHSDWPV